MSNSESVTSRIRHFFYDTEVPFALAMIRISLPIILMGLALPRWVVCRELYSSDGATGQLSAGFLGVDLLPEFSGDVVASLYAVMLFAMVSLSMGWCSRVSAFISFVLLTYFSMLDVVSTMTKYLVISSHLFFLLSLSDCGAIWSVDAWFANRKRNLDPTQPRISYPQSAAWPRRLIQLHIAFVYFGAAMTKIHTPAFFTGDQLQYWMLTHLNYQHPVGEFFSLYPILLVAMGYVTVVWEVMFIFCAWKSSWRSIILPIGIFFHFMTALTLGLLMFPMVCYCAYLSYLDDDDVRQSFAWLRRRSRRFTWLKSVKRILVDGASRWSEHPEWRRPAQIAFAVALPTIAFLGLELEHHWDLYNERGPGGKPELVAIDPEHANRLLARVTPQRDIDKFFAVDMGTFLVSDLLADRRNSFRQGETMIAQCNLVPPHEDMVVECKLRDDANRVVNSMVAVGTREMFRVNINFPISENMKPGEYSMTVETAGRHVMKKKFTVLPKYGTVATR